MTGRRDRRRGGALGWVVLVVCLAALVAAAALADAARRLKAQQRSTQTAVTVETDPPAAEVWLDGKFVGLSPAQIDGLGFGEHLFEARCGGHVPLARRETVGPNPGLISLKLERQATGGIGIQSVPDGAEVLLDGQSRGNTPLEIGDLAPGTYRLVLHKAGRDYWSQPVTVQAGKTTPVSAQLQDHVLTFLLAAVEADPKKIASWTELGHYYGVRGREDESAEAFKKGLALCMQGGASGDDVQRHFQMLSRQMHWPGRDRTEFRNKITAAFAALAAENADNPQAVARLAGILEQQRRFADAMSLYVAACRKGGGTNPDLVGQGFALGLRLGQVEASREIAELARKGRPQDGSIRVVLGTHCLAGYARLEGRAQEDVLALADDLFGEAAKLLPERAARAQALYSQARAQSFRNRTAEAAATYARAAEELAAAKGDRTKWADWLFESATLQLKLSRTEEARAMLARIVKEAPDCPARGRAQRELDRLAPPPPPPPPPPPATPPSPTPAPSPAPPA